MAEDDVEQDDGDRGVTHHVHRIRLDLATGEVLEDRGESGPTRHPDAVTRDAAAAEARSRLTGS
ncbi:MAG: hypothetical protein ACXVX8_16240 [Blastococcus sp.]